MGEALDALRQPFRPDTLCGTFRVLRGACRALSTLRMLTAVVLQGRALPLRLGPHIEHVAVGGERELGEVRCLVQVLVAHWLARAALQARSLPRRQLRPAESESESWHLSPHLVTIPALK